MLAVGISTRPFLCCFVLFVCVFVYVCVFVCMGFVCVCVCV